MNVRVLLLAVSLPAIALIVGLQFSLREEPAEVAGIGAESSAEVAPVEGARSGPLSVSRQPDWIREPLRFEPDPRGDLVDPLAAANARQTVRETGDAAALRLRQSVNAPVPFGISAARLSDSARERRSALLGQYMTDAGWPTIPALPGVNGFDVRVCPEFVTCLSDRLAAEAEDPNWARPMEARLLAQLSLHASTGVAQVHVACRQSVCGILLPTPRGSSQPNATRLASNIARELGFETHSVAELDAFRVLYLSTTPAEEVAAVITR